MTGRFGPQTAHVEAFISAIRDLTDAEAENVTDAWLALSDDDEGDAAWYTARYAAQGAGRSAAWFAAARPAAWDAAQALVVADLVGQYGLTRDHLNILTGPARTVPRLATIIDRALPTKEN